ncbi:RHS repeat domain-containing protein, partial [Akkermansia muciniphila]
IANSYSYAPFGEVTQRGNITNPLQWSSEMFDGELELVYYNYRHYNPHDGRWISRDPITEQEELNLYAFLGNSTQDKVDRLGLLGVSDILDIVDQTGIAQLKNVLIGLGCACMLGACIAMRNKVIMALAKGDGHKAMELDRKKTILCNYAAECARNSLGK